MNDLREVHQSANIKSISDISIEYEISIRALRLYEEHGILCPLRIDGTRFFRKDDEHRLRCLITGRRLGFSLRQIHALFDRHLAKEAHLPESFTAMLDLDDIRENLAMLQARRDAVDAALTELRSRLTEEASSSGE